MKTIAGINKKEIENAAVSNLYNITSKLCNIKGLILRLFLLFARKLAVFFWEKYKDR